MSGPIIDEFGNQKWNDVNGYLHREDGPAFIWANGDQNWYKNGRPHRTDGPSDVYIGGLSWWINGQSYHNNQSFQKAAKLSDEDMLAIVLKYGNVK